MKTYTIILILIILTFIFSCKNKSIKQDQEVSNDGSFLFNGENLDGWNITQFGTQGPVQVTDGTIMLGMGDGLTGITWSKNFPEQNYLVTLEAKRISGNDFFCGITFPVNDKHCSFIIGGWGGPVVGLSTIDGKDASENQTQTLMHFEIDKWYGIKLKVSENKIEAWIDSLQVVDFDTQGHKISIRPEVGLSRPFGIASWNTTAAIRNIRLKLE